MQEMPDPKLVLAEPLFQEVRARNAGCGSRLRTIPLLLGGLCVAVLTCLLPRNLGGSGSHVPTISLASAQRVAAISTPAGPRLGRGWARSWCSSSPLRNWCASTPRDGPRGASFHPGNAVVSVRAEGGDWVENLLNRPPPNVDNLPPRGAVITGGANGVGFAYADSFMKRGHSVVICDIKDPKDAVAALEKKYSGSAAKVYGIVTDVSDAASVEKLGQFAKKSLGTIHYWINNAGINGGRRPFTTLSTNTIEAVVKVDLIGVLLCTKVALEIMQSQSGVTGHIFNTVGSGVKGGGTPGYAAYGACKRGLPQLTKSLVDELTKGVPGFDVEKPAGTVNCHTISPGMVFTKLLLDDSTPELRKFPFGVLAAQPEEVGEDLVPKILATKGNGESLQFLTTEKTLYKFYQKFLLGKKSEYIDDDGNVIKVPGEQYDEIGVRKLY